MYRNSVWISYSADFKSDRTIEVVVYNYSAYVTMAIPVVIVVMNPDEFPGSAQIRYIPVVSPVAGSGKYLIILMAVFFSISADISLITLTVRSVKRITIRSGGYKVSIITPAFYSTILIAAALAVFNLCRHCRT